MLTGLEQYYDENEEFLDLFVNDDPGDWGEFNPGHTYECTILGVGLSVALWIYDRLEMYEHNSGSLTVDIYEIS